MNRSKIPSLFQLIAFEESKRDSLGAGARAAKQAIESGQNNIKFMDKNYQTIFEWLQDNNKQNRF